MTRTTQVFITIIAAALAGVIIMLNLTPDSHTETEWER